MRRRRQRQRWQSWTHYQTGINYDIIIIQRPRHWYTVIYNVQQRENDREYGKEEDKDSDKDGDSDEEKRRLRRFSAWRAGNQSHGDEEFVAAAEKVMIEGIKEGSKDAKCKKVRNHDRIGRGAMT